MNKRLTAALAIGAGMLGVLGGGGGSALAATEFGDTCVGNGAAPGNYTLTTKSDPSSLLPVTAPVSGVITQVKSNIDSSFLPPPVPTSVKVLHPTGTPEMFKVTAEAQVMLLAGALNTASVRMPVVAGDQLGLHGAGVEYEPGAYGPISYLCGTDHAPGSKIQVIPGDVLLGATGTFFQPAEQAVPLVARIEPDVDGDGYGDETQDKCPELASLQTPCPPVGISLIAQPGNGKVTVLLTADAQAPVRVGGVVSLGKGKQAKLDAGAKIVSPGTIAQFQIKFTAKLKAKLKELPSSSKLKLAVTATATNVAGKISTATKAVKLRGQS